MGTIRQEIDKQNPIHLTVFHCIFHQESLCGKNFLSLNMLWTL